MLRVEMPLVSVPGASLCSVFHSFWGWAELRYKRLSAGLPLHPRLPVQAMLPSTQKIGRAW